MTLKRTSMILLAPLWSLLALDLHAQVGGELRPPRSIAGPVSSSEMGYSVASAGDLDGDGISDLLVGAPGAGIPPDQADRGTAFVYSGADRAVILQLFGEAPGDRFGGSVAGIGDINSDGIPDLVIGAYYTDALGFENAGTAYVFSGADGSLIRRHDGVEDWAVFGFTVAGVGDIDADGVADYGVTTTGEDGSLGRSPGFVYLYSGATGNLYLRLEGTGYQRGFGTSMDTAGDIDGDGHNDILIGEPGGDGRAWVHSGADGSTLRAFDFGHSFDALGQSVAYAGDWNDDGHPDYVLGAPSSSEIETGSGSVIVVSGIDGEILFHEIGETSLQYFGNSVASGEDFDGDGHPDLIVGSTNFYVEPLIQSGAIFIYSGATQELVSRIAAPIPYARIGASVTFAGDADSDGLVDILFGAPGRDALYGQPGNIGMVSLDPFLYSEQASLSAAQGGWWRMHVDFPETYAGFRYRILLSGTGAGPNHYGVTIPLTLDGLAISSYLGNYPFARHHGFEGLLDANGQAEARAYLPSSALLTMVGQSLWTCAIAHEIGEPPAVSSAVRVLTIDP